MIWPAGGHIYRGLAILYDDASPGLGEPAHSASVSLMHPFVAAEDAVYATEIGGPPCPRLYETPEEVRRGGKRKSVVLPTSVVQRAGRCRKPIGLVSTAGMPARIGNISPKTKPMSIERQPRHHGGALARATCHRRRSTGHNLFEIGEKILIRDHDTGRKKACPEVLQVQDIWTASGRTRTGAGRASRSSRTTSITAGKCFCRVAWLTYSRHCRRPRTP